MSLRFLIVVSILNFDFCSPISYWKTLSVMHAMHRYHMQGVQKGDPLLFAKAPKLI